MALERVFYVPGPALGVAASCRTGFAAPARLILFERSFTNGSLHHTQQQQLPSLLRSS